MAKRRRVVVGVGPTLPSPPSRSTPHCRRGHPRPQPPPQSASSHPGVNDVPALGIPVMLHLLFPASIPHLHLHLHRLRPNPEPFPFAKALTCMDAVCSCRCLPKSPTPLRLRLHPLKVCMHFNLGSLPPVQALSCLIVAFLLVNQARFKLMWQCCLLCRKLI
jgi:hypothetical protein